MCRRAGRQCRAPAVRSLRGRPVVGSVTHSTEEAAAMASAAVARFLINIWYKS